MVEESFSIRLAWGIGPPCFVRKVDRSGHWRDAATIQDKVFRPEPDDNTISVYRVNSAVDLARVAIALNANRSSKTEPIFLVAISAGELAGLCLRQNEGETLCQWANHLHYDVLVTDPTQTAVLARRLFDAKRELRKFLKKEFQAAIEYTSAGGWYAADPDSRSCVCEEELNTARRPAFFSWIADICTRIASLADFNWGRRRK